MVHHSHIRCTSLPGVSGGDADSRGGGDWGCPCDGDDGMDGELGGKGDDGTPGTEGVMKPSTYSEYMPPKTKVPTSVNEVFCECICRQLYFAT